MSSFELNTSTRIFITGGGGLVGQALVRFFQNMGFDNICYPSSKELDLLDYEETKKRFIEFAPDIVFHTAARVYGIMGNMQNKGLSYLDNTLINTHVVEASRLSGVKKVVAMGTGCIYPYPSPGLPLKENMIWLGYPHHAEDSYAISKRSMLVHLNSYKESYDMDFAFVISGNLYGPGDKFDEEQGHVTPSLISKFYKSLQNGDKISVWGDGSARRDFLFADDVAKALIYIARNVSGPVNMGSGKVISIKDIVDTLGQITGLSDRVEWDSSMPNGQDYRAYDLSTLNGTGFVPDIDLKTGLTITWEWFCSEMERGNIRR